MAEGKYKSENLSAIQKYYEQIGSGDKNFFISSEVPLYKMPVGDQTLRILPAMEAGEFFGKEIFVHEWVGMNKDSFLCLEKMKRNEDDVCPFCEQAKRLSKANAVFEEILPFKPRKKVLLNLVDVNKDKDGVKVWIAPFTVVDEILLASYDRKAKVPRDISDPDEGHDIFITRDGDGKTTKYKGIQMDPNNTPVDQSWLDNRFDLDGILIYPEEKDMQDAIESMAGTVDTGERHPERNSRSRSTGAVDGTGAVRQAADIPFETAPEITPVEEPVNLKDQIAQATAGKYGAARTGRTRA